MGKSDKIVTQSFAQRRIKVLRDSFKGKTTEDHPQAIVMAGPQGSGELICTGIHVLE